MNKTKIQNIILYFINFILIGFIIFSNKNLILNNNRITLKNMNESIQVTDLNKTIEELNKSHTDYLNYIQTSKIAIATALTNEGVVTSNEDTFETMTTNIGKVLQSRTSNATATADNISKGKTAWVNGELVVGNGSDISNYIESLGENFLYINYKGNHTYYAYHNVSKAKGFTYNGSNFTLEKGKYIMYYDNLYLGIGLATADSNGTSSGSGTNTPIEYEIVSTLLDETINSKHPFLCIINVPNTTEVKLFTNGYSGGRNFDRDFILIKI